MRSTSATLQVVAGAALRSSSTSAPSRTASSRIPNASPPSSPGSGAVSGSDGGGGSEPAGRGSTRPVLRAHEMEREPVDRERRHLELAAEQRPQLDAQRDAVRARERRIARGLARDLGLLDEQRGREQPAPISP